MEEGKRAIRALPLQFLTYWASRHCLLALQDKVASVWCTLSILVKYKNMWSLQTIIRARYGRVGQLQPVGTGFWTVTRLTPLCYFRTHTRGAHTHLVCSLVLTLLALLPSALHLLFRPTARNFKLALVGHTQHKHLCVSIYGCEYIWVWVYGCVIAAVL